MSKIIIDIAALRPSERAKLGFVTDDNTGGYYVAECEECGKIFPSQTCDGGEQIANTGDYGDCYCPHCGHVDPQGCDNANLVWNVQQLNIINLTSQLEAERDLREAAEQRNTELTGTIVHAKGLFVMQCAATEASEKERDRIDQRNAEMNSTLERWAVERAENANEIAELRAAIKKAGFTVVEE